MAEQVRYAALRVRLLAEMIPLWCGRVFDPCCSFGPGAPGFVHSLLFVSVHKTGNDNGGGGKRDISLYGQEPNHMTRRLAKMNLAIRDGAQA